MEDFLQKRGILFKHLKTFVLQQADWLKTHGHAVATQAGRPFEYLPAPLRKDQRARTIAARDGITEGLVCVFSTLEPCRTFRLAYGHGRPTVQPAWRKCLFLYFYYLDREFGFLHVRVQTWFPFTIHVYLNGHEWLARQMDQRGLAYHRLECTAVEFRSGCRWGESATWRTVSSCSTTICLSPSGRRCTSTGVPLVASVAVAFGRSRTTMEGANGEWRGSPRCHRLPGQYAEVVMRPSRPGIRPAAIPRSHMGSGA